MSFIDTLESFKSEFATLEQRASSAEAEREEFRQRALDAEARLATIAGALNISVSAIGLTIAPEPLAEMSQYPVEEPVEVASPVQIAAPIKPDNLDGSEALMMALGTTTEFLKVTALHHAAKLHGFPFGEGTVRNRMATLMKARPGEIEQQDNPLAWRLKSAPPAPEPSPPTDRVKVKQPTVPEGFPRRADFNSNSEAGRARTAWVNANLEGLAELPQCQICERRLQANDGIVRDHGHKRRDGYNEGACDGSGKMPLALDFKAIVRVLEVSIPNEIDHFQTIIKAAENGTFRWLHGGRPYVVTKENFCEHKDKFDMETFDEAKKHVIGSYNSQLKTVFRERDRLQKSLDQWQPKPMLANQKRVRKDRGGSCPVAILERYTVE